MTAQTYGPPRADASFRAALRLVRDEGGALGLAPLSESDASLEVTSTTTEQPRLASARLLEGPTFAAREVPDAMPGEPAVAFSAFLDGTQRSRSLTFTRDGVPIVFATVAAVIRRRVERRMTTWTAPRVESYVFAPKSRLDAGDWAFLHRLDVEVLDTNASAEDDGALHPFALRDVALHSVRAARERVEIALAEEWCAREWAPLFVDGGIGASAALASSAAAVGVVKSHHTLYAEGAALSTVFGLRAGWRSSVFAIESRRRTTVASWYLRLRAATGRDPFFGLVRVEVALSDDVTGRADEVSRMVRAEVSPLALPDGRWDRMVYGIRDCEEFLKAIC